MEEDCLHGASAACAEKRRQPTVVVTFDEKLDSKYVDTYSTDSRLDSCFCLAI